VCPDPRRKVVLVLSYTDAPDESSPSINCDENEDWTGG
jgi:hypothetical protein